MLLRHRHNLVRRRRPSLELSGAISAPFPHVIKTLLDSIEIFRRIANNNCVTIAHAHALSLPLKWNSSLWKEITMPKTKEAPAPKAEKAAVISTLPQDQIPAR